MESYVDYRMTLLPVTFSDRERHFCCLQPFYLTYLAKYSVCYQ